MKVQSALHILRFCIKIQPSLNLKNKNYICTQTIFLSLFPKYSTTIIYIEFIVYLVLKVMQILFKAYRTHA